MNLRGLREVFRREVDDQTIDYKWDDPEVNEFANDAVMEAVRRAHLITDSVTAAICTLAFTADPVLPLDSRVITVVTAIVRGQAIPLDPIAMRRIEVTYPGWRTQTARIPIGYLTDYSTGAIRLYPIPTVACTIDLTVKREPLVAMVGDTDVPEIPARYHANLRHWMRFRAYSKDDSVVFDQQRADRAEKAFAAEFGERVPARNEQWAAEQVGEERFNALC